MTHDDRLIDLTRRKLLIGAGAVGLASAGAGLGTAALFGDTELFEGNSVIAGDPDLIVEYWTAVDQGSHGRSFGIAGQNEDALNSMNIAAYDVRIVPGLTADDSTNDDIRWRSPQWTAGNISSFSGADAGGGQVMSRFEARAL